MVQKRKWIAGVWRLYDPKCKEEDLFATLEKMGNDDGTGLNGMIGSARFTAREFIWRDPCGISTNIRGFIDGPRYSGKTSFLRTLFLQFLSVFANAGICKAAFIVPIHLRARALDTKESFYQLISEAVVDAVLGQRLDVQLFSHTLHKAFAQLFDRQTVKRLPKPLSFQDFLRRPMGRIEKVLATLLELYLGEHTSAAFLQEVACLPQTFAAIFEFSSTFLIIDDLDLLNVEIEGVNLLRMMKPVIAQSQFLVSGIDCDLLRRELFGFNIVRVTDTCRSQFRDKYLSIRCKSKVMPHLRADARICGGCPAFIMRYDDICRRLVKHPGIANAVKRDEEMIRAMQLTEVLLDLVMSFRGVTLDGEPPEITALSIVQKRAPGEVRSRPKHSD
jgi:hypothetical protein